MQFKKILKIFSTAVVIPMFAVPAHAQDVLARQAPVDRKMKTVDTLMLKNLIHREELEMPGEDLYDDWDNTYAHRATPLPETFKIDLRHFCMPTTSRVVTSNFGARWGRQHKGIDIKVYTGDTIRAAFAGKVRIVRYDAGGYGNFIVIRHNNGLETIYGHLSRQLVDVNENVRAGDVIGLGGNTGRSTGSHLHFETRICGVAINPALLFDFRNQDVVADSYLFQRDTYQDESYEANALRGKIGSGGYTREDVEGYGNDIAFEQSHYRQDRQERPLHQSMPNYYQVKRSGATIEDVARKVGVSVSQICDMNHMRPKMRLKRGQIVRY